MREEKILNIFGERNRPPVLKPERIAFAFIEEDRSELDKGRMNVTLRDAELEICRKLGQQGLRQIFPDLVAEAVGARCAVREAWDSQGKKVLPEPAHEMVQHCWRERRGGWHSMAPWTGSPKLRNFLRNLR